MLRTLFASIAVALFAASQGLAQSSDFGQSIGNITINPPPKFETCKPVNITWSGGYESGDYVLYFYPAESQGDEILLFVNSIKDQFYTWPVFLEAGTRFLINVFDQGNDEFAGPFTIEDSGDTSCVFPMEEYRSSLSARVAGAEPTSPDVGVVPGLGSITTGVITGTNTQTPAPTALNGPSLSSSPAQSSDASASASPSSNSQPNGSSRLVSAPSGLLLGTFVLVAFMAL